MNLSKSIMSLSAASAVVAGALLGAAAPAQAAPVETWDAIAACESTNRWDINTGNGFYGGLQFTLTSWQAVGGSGYPHQATKAEQIKRAEMLQDLQGWGAWPACSAKLGLTGPDTAPDAVVGKTATPAPVAVERTSTTTKTKVAPVAKTDTQREQLKAEVTKAAKKVGVSTTELKKAEVANKKNESKLAAAEQTIVVKPGDSLWKISHAHNVAGGWQSLYAANASIIKDPSMIYVGQELILPTA